MDKLGTGVSSPYGQDPSKHDSSGGVTFAGLVLLYAPNFTQFEPAYALRSPTLFIGRELSNGICVPEQAVSRQHARIEWDGRRWQLFDLGSRNGTLVGGVQVKDVELHNSAEIRVGDAIFKFVDEGAERYIPYRIDGFVRGERRARLLGDELVGGAQTDRIAADLERIATTELSCVILGETGTGKEVAARGVHRASGRSGSFQAINCAAIPQNLLESELFGYRRGAFSGADRDKPGLIKLADQGTLFLDEIGDMPLEAQAKLLRVLQAREVFPLGAQAPEKVNLRVICATHRDLNQYVREGRFRGDLFARLNEHVVRLPPLAQRKEDIYLLATTFSRRFGCEPRFSFPFMTALLHYPWPFNVRELESCIKRAVALGGNEMFERKHLPEAIREHMQSYAERGPTSGSLAPPSSFAPTSFAPLREPSFAPRSAAAPFEGRPDTTSPPPDAMNARGITPTEHDLRASLARHQGNLAAVGRDFGRERMQVHRWLKKYAIDPDSYRVE